MLSNVITARNRQSIVIHSRQDLSGQVVGEAVLLWRWLETEVRRPSSARHESAQLLSGLKKGQMIELWLIGPTFELFEKSSNDVIGINRSNKVSKSSFNILWTYFKTLNVR